MSINKELRSLDNHPYYYLKWTIEKPTHAIVIAHGMAEHPARYEEFAKYLNTLNYDVYALFEEGHGEPYKDNLGHFEKNGFNECVENINDLVLKIKDNYQKVALFGHSMGSFISQDYLSKFSENIDACILCGSSSPTFIIKIAKYIAGFIYLLPGKNKPSHFMDKLGFGGYNKQFEPARTKFDWLSRDENEVDKYIADDYCGYVCTRGFYKSFISNFAKLHKKKKLRNIRKDIPIFIIGGSKDPVSNNGEGLRTLLVKYKENNINDVTLKIYDDYRHEILNEIDKKVVYNDIKEWLDSRLNEENE